jgi:hypothetical protein
MAGKLTIKRGTTIVDTPFFDSLTDIGTVIKNLKPCLTQQEKQYKKEKIQLNGMFQKIAEIIEKDTSSYNQYKRGTYIEKQITVPQSLIQFIA